MKLLLLLTLILAPSAALSQALRLSSLNGTCATGFALENSNRIITNHHVAAGLCESGRCAQVKVESHTGEISQVLDFTVTRALPALDIAMLEPASELSPQIMRLTLSDRAPVPGEEIRMIGFPSCSGFAEAIGKIEEVHTLYIRTSAQGASGSSGSPMLAADGSVIAVANESDSFMRALSDKLSGSSFALRATPSIIITKLLQLPAEQNIEHQLELLNVFYKKDLQSLSGTARLRGSINFLSRASAIRAMILEASADGELPAVSAYLDQPPGSFLNSTRNPPSGRSAKLAEQLFFAANLEARGSAAAPSLEKISQSKRDAEQQKALSEILTIAKESKFPGSIAFGAVAVLPGVLGLAGLLIIYGITLGYVFARSQGGVVARFLKTLLVGIAFWPLSLIAWAFLSRRCQSASLINGKGTT